LSEHYRLNCLRKRPSKLLRHCDIVHELREFPRFLFKKWLELEKRMGDEAGVENVKDKAIEWTRNAAKGGPEQEQD